MFLADLPDRARVATLDRESVARRRVRTALGREVFLYYPNGTAPQQAHERLLRLQALDHQHIPKLEDGGEDPGDGHGDRLSRGR